MDYEKEEKWLNEMAAKGLAMTAYSFCCYTFEDTNPGEYIYRIEMLPHGLNHPESVHYIHFMEENGVEHVDTYRTWIYFRKKATDGAFEIYSDIDSRINHYQRVSNFWLVLSGVWVCFSFAQLSGVIRSLEEGTSFWVFSLTLGGMLFPLTILCLSLWHQYHKKIKWLKRERAIQE